VGERGRFAVIEVLEEGAPITRHFPRFGKVVVLVALVLALAGLPAFAGSPNIVISQVYGGGGNSGATYKSDFIELFNRGATPVNVAGWSVQYASAAGSSWSVTNLSGTIQPGQYYLVQESAGAGGTTNLPTPDATGSINMSATAGNVALVNITTAQSGTCPTGSQIVDFVGFGTTANCYEGGGPAPAPSNTTAVLRAAGGCTDTDSNSGDFTAGVPVPRNSASPRNVCSASTPPSGVGSANPLAIQVGESSTLAMTVTPGGNPVSTGLVVICDLTAIGGGASQMFYDDGTHGDVTTGDNVFSFFTGVGGGTTSGAKTLPCTITDTQSRTANTNITLQVVTLTKIHDIQGPGNSSPFNTQTVSTRGVVTALLSNAFFIEEPDAGWDADPNTSEGLYIYAAPVGLARGDLVTVKGVVQEYSPATEPLQPTTTELGGVSVTSKFSSGNPLPSVVTIYTGDTNPAGGFYQLEKYEAMRVQASPSITVVGPTGGTVDEANATSTSSGWFWGVVTGIARPFRETGANVLDPLTACVGPCVVGSVPRFDGNPERFDIGTRQQVGGTSLDVRAGDVVTGLVGPLLFTTSAGYRAWQIFPDPGTGVVSTPGPDATAAPAANGREFTVASFNMERFFDTVDNPAMDNSYEAILTPTAFANRLNKASLAIRNYIRYPDILAVAEVENLTTLQAIATKINTDAVAASDPNPQYVAYLQNGTDIAVGFLVKSAIVAGSTPRVSVSAVVAENAGELFTNPDSTTELLNDRPPLRLMATIHHANGASFPMTVIAIHQKALASIDSTSPGSNGWSTVGARNRVKRQKQARSLAALINARQVADPTERIIVAGDLNAFEFNDGYTDVTNITTGAAPQTADINVILGNGPVIYTTPPLTDLISFTTSQRYSYSDYGSAQNLDHLMVNSALQSATVTQRLEHARIDADFSETDRNDQNSARRLSDHDPLVGYFEVPAFATTDLSASFTFLPENPTDAMPISFTASASGGTAPYTYTWDLAGGAATGQEVTWWFRAGTQTVTLSVTDAVGAKATSTHVIEVAALARRHLGRSR